MELKQLIERRRAYRVVKPVTINDHIIQYLIWASKLAPSCFNNQPWRYVFVRSKDKLEKMRDALSEGNEWAYEGSLIVAVFSNKKDDCIVAKRNYYLFDTGISAGFLIMAATDLGLVAHPIAGYSEKKAKEILNIPDHMKLITLIVIGEHDPEAVKKLNEDNQKKEMERPARKSFEEFVWIDEYENDIK